MSLEIIKTYGASDESWDDFWKASDTSTAFHSRDWAEIWQVFSSGRLQPQPEIVEFSDGRRVLLPLTSEKILRGCARLVHASPGGTFGGWIAEEKLTPEHADCLVRFIRERYGNLQWRCSPYDFEPPAEAGFDPARDVTHVINLEDDAELLVSRMNKKQIPRKVRIAERNGLVLKEIGAEFIEAYTEIYQDCKERWERSTSAYTRDFFQRLERADICEFWGVFDQEERLICAGPILCARRHVVSWLALARSEALEFKPYEFFYYKLILHYREQGKTWFDMNPSGGHKGVAAFKANFGAQEKRCPLISQKSRKVRMLESLAGLLRTR